jgi:phosphopantothenoylcysteine decarboxylase/phosphopantothenate--cysteine ligase
MTGRRLILAVSGGIAAYKAAELASRLVRAGANVRVVMTAAAQRFVTPLTFRTLTGHPVVTDLWTEVEPEGVIHVTLADFAEVLVIAPATANIIGKMAAGIADDAVSTLALSVDVPIVIAPAMNTRMWEQRVVQRNLEALRERGAIIVLPEAGRLACGAEGIGRLAETETLLAAIRKALGE